MPRNKSKKSAAIAPKLDYMADYAELPIDGPVGHPHLVDPKNVTEDFLPKDLTVADTVVTVLFKFMPEALTAFLDLERPKVHYIQAGSKGSRLDFCIKRDKRVVTIGFLNEKEVGGWDLQYQYRIDGKATGMWIPIRMSIGDGYDVTKARDIREGAPGFAFTILMHKPWTRPKPGQEIEWVSGLSYDRNL